MTEIVINPPAVPTVVVQTTAVAPVNVGPFDPSLLTPPLRLNVIQAGQTRFNVGGSEVRSTLYLNGVRQQIGVDYQLNLPYLDWLSSVELDPEDSLVLTIL